MRDFDHVSIRNCYGQVLKVQRYGLEIDFRSILAEHQGFAANRSAKIVQRGKLSIGVRVPQHDLAANVAPGAYDVRSELLHRWIDENPPLDGAGWVALAYLAWPCTVVGFALWTWLLRYLPATAVGLTVFLNPPLATISKAVLSRAWPESFSFAIEGREWVGGAIVLAGLAIGLGRRLGVR